MDNEKFYKNLLDSMDDGIYFVDKHRKITFWNKGAERISGFSAKHILDKYCFDNILNHVDDKGTHLCKQGCPLHQTLIDGKKREAIVYLHHNEGNRVPVTIKVVPIKENGKIVGAVEIFNDDSKKYKMVKDIEKLRFLSMYDQLTGLANRRYIDTFLESKMKEYKTLDIPFGIGFMDIDKFKKFNDTYGHDLGDEVLKMVSKVFSVVARGSDLVGRWGGEEFIGVFSGINKENLKSILEKTRMLVENSYIVRDNKELKVTISIGGTMVKKSESIQDAVRRADKLLYKSKSSGRNKVTMG